MKNGPSEVAKEERGRVTQVSWIELEIYFDWQKWGLPTHRHAEGGARGERAGGTGKRPPLGIRGCPPGHCQKLTGFG